ncbi:hypothetical protein [Nocardia sp. MW-W600-9]
MNAKRYRGAHTTDQMSRHAREFGLKWNAGRVSALEKGDISPTIPNLVAVAGALRSLTGQDVTLADLLTYEGRVELNEVLTVPGERLVSFVNGDAVRLLASEIPAFRERSAATGRVLKREFMDRDDWTSPDQLDRFNRWQAAIFGATDADERAAADLGLRVAELQQKAVDRWGRGFSAERDARAGEGANNQKRGRVARDLKAELREVISRGND